MATELTAEDEERPSLLFLIVDAIAFWIRSPLTFWIVAVPIAALAALLAYALDTNQTLVALRNHWGWNFLFALIYALFLDRWIKASLLDGASPCEEVDNLRRSIVSPRFLGLATVLFLLELGLSELNYSEMSIVVWSAVAALFALYLPSLSAAEPLSLRQALRTGRTVQIHFFLLIAGSVAISLLAGMGLERLAEMFAPQQVWAPAAIAAGQRIVDCVLLAVVGNALAAVFRAAVDWRQPEPDDHPYRRMGPARRKTSAG